MKFLYKLTSFCMLMLLLMMIVLIGVFYHFGKGLPYYNELATYEPPVVSRIYANDGSLFGEYAHEQRVFLPIQAIPERVKQAFIAAEDRNFYKHPGIDFIAIIRSAWRNIARIASNKRPIGGSTITQQVARNFLLTETARHVSVERKIKEAILSLRIEHAFTKNHIFELYLNEIYLGNRSYGVAAAALNYFNKSLNELSLSEVAFLAGLPKAPSLYNPKTNNTTATERRNYVINRMEEEGFVSPKDAEHARREPLVSLENQRLSYNVVTAPYFADEVRKIVIGQCGEKSLYQGGLTIRTTLDGKLQKIAHDSLREGLISYDRRHGWRGPVAKVTWDAASTVPYPWLDELQKVTPPAGRGAWKLAVVMGHKDEGASIGLLDKTTGLVPISEMKWARTFKAMNSLGPAVRHSSDVVSVGDVVLVDVIDATAKTYTLCQIPKVSGALVAMDPFTGQVKAMQGGFNYDISQYNRVTQAMRQPGSSFKPFAYLAGLESGLNPSTILVDAPISIPLGKGMGAWQPQNFDKKFLGPMTLRRAFEGSRNTVTVRMIYETVGMKKVVDVAKRFGLHDNLPMQLAILLGAGETTVMKQVAAYSMLANGGRKIEPILIDRIQSRQGKTVYCSDKRTCRGCDHKIWANQSPPELIDDRESVTRPEMAYQMTYLLQGVAEHGTGKLIPELTKRPYAGKTGTTNNFRDAWYAGYSSNLVVVVYVGYDDPISLGDKEYGARVAAPIFADFMSKALAGKPAVPFRVPPGIKHVKVNYETGFKAKPGERNVILEAFDRNTPVPGSVDYSQNINPIEPDSNQIY